MPHGSPAPVLFAAAVAAFAWLAPPAVGQVMMEVNGEMVQVPEGVNPAEVAAAQQAAAAGGGETPDGDAAKPADAAGGGEAQPAGNPEIIKRPTTPPAADEGYDDRRLFDPAGDGTYSFNFRGAPWAAVLTQLADASNLSLDWQELPGDYLNLRTQRDYTAEEARDLINRHLLARGFTLLTNGEILSVANLKTLDPGAVPPVEPEELADMKPHAFVKVVFPLTSVPAERAAEELKALLSPHGKLVALPGSNRLLALDAAKNLREVAAVLKEEQAGRGRERLVQVFHFQHMRADRAKELLEEFLGIAEEDDALPADPQQAQMMMQMRMQQAQQGGGGDAGKKKEAEVRLIVNDRENSILAQAPPEQMAVIELSHKALDVPRDPGEGLLAKMVMREKPVQIYRLARLDPELLVRMLSNSGELDPMTRIEVDKKANAVVVDGPPADHLVIAKLVEALDGTDRSFEVVPLRRLPADYVAGTIKFMMGVEEEKKDDNSRSNRYSYFSYGYGSSPDEKKDEVEGKFRVDADVQKNRLLLWANPVELAEVNALLVKLGEVRPGGAGRRPVRVLDVTEEQAREILDRLETVWPRVRENPLRLPAAPGPAPAPDDQPDDGEPVASFDAPPAVRPAAFRRDDGRSDDENRPAADPKPAAPPVVVRRTPDGRLVLESDDLDALDALEDLAADLTPPQADFHVFQLENVDYTAWLVGQLEDFFKADGDDGKETLDWFGDPINVRDDSPDRLSKRKPLRFIGDRDTRTILVQNASPAQLRQIRDLLNIWDRSPEQKGGSLRLTKLWNLRNAEAKQVAATLKDVYRDLLSTNDPALQQEGGDDKKTEAGGPAYTYVYGRRNNDAGDEGAEPEPPIRFKGLISVGVHEESNTLVVSASEGLMENVSVLVDELEANAKVADAASLMWQGGPTAEEEIKTRLKDFFGDRVTLSPEAEEPPVRVGEVRTLGVPE